MGTSQPIVHEGEGLRSDARATRAKIIAAARTLLDDRRASMVQLAAAAGVGRATLYRHFGDRAAVLAAIEAEDAASGAAPSEVIATLPHRAPGRLGSPHALTLEVTHILDEVPPHLIADQLVAEARRVAGVAIGLYVVDIDGSQLVRLAGSEDFPAELEAPPALGPEIVPEGLPEFYMRLREILPRCEATPLWLRGRVLGLLVAVGTPVASLEDIAKQGAAALELADDYTDLVESARRRKPTTASAEVQYHLLPPRIARVTGAQLAGGLLPSYEVGGDWFDFVENRDAAWIAIAEAATGGGPHAAGLGAAALGALRAARRAGQDLPEAAASVDALVRELGKSSYTLRAVLARWHAPTGTLAWIACGGAEGFIAEAAGAFAPLGGREHRALGEGKRASSFEVSSLRLETGDRLVLVTDGITGRHLRGGGTFGAEGVEAAVAAVPSGTAATTAMSIQHAVAESWAEPLEDDATLVVLSVD